MTLLPGHAVLREGPVPAVVRLPEPARQPAHQHPPRGLRRLRRRWGRRCYMPSHCVLLHPFDLTVHLHCTSVPVYQCIVHTRRIHLRIQATRALFSLAFSEATQRGVHLYLEEGAGH